MSPVKGYLALPFMGLMLAVLSLSGCRGGTSESDDPGAVTVRVAEVTGGPVEEIPLRFSGLVRAAQRATLPFQLSGTFKARPGTLGPLPTPGHTLARR